MSIKTFVITGSPRKDGVTAAMLNIFLEQWKSVGEDAVTILDAYKANIKPCDNCGFCKYKPSCIYDDYDGIDKELKESDLLVIVSPVYCLGFPSPLKAIFDRTQQYFEAKFSRGIAKPIQKHKTALFFTAYGSKDPRGVKMMQDQIKLVSNVLNITLTDTVIAPNTDNTKPDFDRITQEIAAIISDIKKLKLV